MSEYQYYEFLAVDRPLGEADRKALRKVSSRAEITARSFTNSYEWGDFKGDPQTMMERWFDLHLYLSNWGTRRLMMKLPRRLVDSDRLGSMLNEVPGVRCDLIELVLQPKHGYSQILMVRSCFLDAGRQAFVARIPQWQKLGPFLATAPHSAQGAHHPALHAASAFAHGLKDLTHLGILAKQLIDFLH